MPQLAPPSAPSVSSCCIVCLLPVVASAAVKLLVDTDSCSQELARSLTQQLGAVCAVGGIAPAAASRAAARRWAGGCCRAGCAGMCRVFYEAAVTWEAPWEAPYPSYRRPAPGDERTFLAVIAAMPAMPRQLLTHQKAPLKATGASAAR